MNTISTTEARALRRKDSSINVLTRLYKEIENAAILGEDYIDNIDFSKLSADTTQAIILQLKDLGYSVREEFNLALRPTYKISWDYWD